MDDGLATLKHSANACPVADIGLDRLHSIGATERSKGPPNPVG
jgi:hypothetical protein